jgi:3-hydroxy-3-methylglutaryl CoA synthase
MTYKEFYTAATEGINFKTISKDDMQFAYIMFHQTFGEAPKKAIESVNLLNSFYLPVADKTNDLCGEIIKLKAN